MQPRLVLDISKGKIEAYDGAKFYVFANGEQLLGLHPKVVFLECTGMYHRPITKILLKNHIAVFEINQYKFKKYREQLTLDVKTDKIDVFAMWKYVQLFENKRIVTTGNALETLLRKHRLISDTVSRWKVFLESCRINNESETVEYMTEKIRAFECDGKQIEKQLRALIPEELRSRYGVILTAACLSLDPSRFPTGKHWASFLGFKLRTYESGTIVKKRSITKRGSWFIRKLLYVRAMTCVRYKREPYYSLFRRLKERGKQGYLPMTVLMRKIAVHFWADCKNVHKI